MFRKNYKSNYNYILILFKYENIKDSKQKFNI